MKNIALSKRQAKELAQAIYADIKSHSQNNFGRYFPWWLSEEHKSKGKLPPQFVSDFVFECPHCGRTRDASLYRPAKCVKLAATGGAK